MLKAHKITEKFDKASDTITLDETARNRRRIKMVSDNGISFLLDLSRAQLLRHGFGIELEDGRIIEVRAEPEALYEIKARDGLHLLQLAWQLGNRHLPAQIFDKGIRIRQDHVIKEMLLGLGATVDDIIAPFDPEGGAYEETQVLEHDHSHGHSQGHTHSHGHGLSHSHSHSHHHEDT